jgi:hypothetical protein
VTVILGGILERGPCLCRIGHTTREASLLIQSSKMNKILFNRIVSLWNTLEPKWAR